MNVGFRGVRSTGVVAALAVMAVGMTACSSGGDADGSAAATTTVTTTVTGPTTTVTASPEAAGAPTTRTIVTTVLADDVGQSGAVASGSAAPGSAQGSGNCGGTTGSWTSADETTSLGTGNSRSPITNVAGAKESCFDRIDITVGPNAQAPAYRVKYVPQVTAQGSGNPVSVPGTAALEVTIDSPANDPQTGQVVFPPVTTNNMIVTNFGAVQQVAYAGSFEGQTTVAIGVDTQRPFQVSSTASSGQGHLIIKVAHQ